VRSCKTAEEIAAVIEQAERGVAVQQLSLDSLAAIKRVGGEQATKLAKAEAAKGQPALAS
jgi:hypothetical protein